MGIISARLPHRQTAAAVVPGPVVADTEELARERLARGGSQGDCQAATEIGMVELRSTSATFQGRPRASYKHMNSRSFG